MKKYGNFTTLEAFADEYERISTEIKALEDVKKTMSAEAKQMFGDGDKIELKNGYFIKYKMERKSYPALVVFQLLGNAAFGFMKVDRTKLDTYVAGQLSLEPGSKKWAKIMTQLTRNTQIDSVTEGLRLVR